MRPSFITATRSANCIASSWSCVTKTTVASRSFKIARTSARSCPRRPASTLEKGSSIKIKLSLGQAEGDVLRHRQVGERRAFLEHHAHPPLLRGVVGARAGHQPVADMHRPRVGGLKTGDQAQRGGFAAAAGTEQTEDFAARQPEIDVGHRRDGPEVFPQARQAESIASDYLNVPPGCVRSLEETSVICRGELGLTLRGLGLLRAARVT